MDKQQLTWQVSPWAPALALCPQNARPCPLPQTPRTLAGAVLTWRLCPAQSLGRSLHLAAGGSVCPDTTLRQGPGSAELSTALSPAWVSGQQPRTPELWEARLQCPEGTPRGQAPSHGFLPPTHNLTPAVRKQGQCQSRDSLPTADLQTTRGHERQDQSEACPMLQG